MTTYQWLPPYGPALYLGLVVVGALLLWLARRWATSPPARSWALLVLRGLVLGLLVLILHNPTWVTETRLPPRPPEMVFLVDCSQSMALDRPLSRLEQVKRSLGQVPVADSASAPIRVSRYRFGRQLLAAPTAGDLRPEEEATLLAETLQRLPARFGSDRPVGVVLFSDGRSTEPLQTAEIAAAYRQLQVPIHVFPVGDRSVIGDVAIQELVVPRNPPPGTRVPVRVQVASYGYEGRRAEVRVRSVANPQAPPLAVLPVTLGKSAETYDLVIESDKAAGDLVVEVPALEGEAIVDNNQVPFQLVSKRKKLRVIYMEATTGSESRWVRDALVEDPNIECLVLEVPYQYTRDQRLFRLTEPSRGYPTTREELFSYDVVICSDIDRNAFTPDQLSWTVELVANRGGGFAMVGGVTSFGAGQWGQTLWDQIIPVKMTGALLGPSNQGYTWGQFRIAIPADAERHPIWRIVEDPVKNRAILDRLPIFLGLNLVDRVKPGATVLGLTDRPLPGAGVTTAFACQTFGKGRTFAMLPDTTVEWGRHFESTWGEGDNRYFRKFWRNVVTWLGENSLGGSQRLRVETDKVIYRSGQPIQVTVRAYDEKNEETTRYRLVARLQRAPGTPASDSALTLEETALSPASDDRAYHGQLTAPPPGTLAAPAAGVGPRATIALEVTAADQNQTVARASLDVQLLNDSLEYHDPRPDRPCLEELAQASGGTVLNTTADLTLLLRDHQAGPGEVVVRRQPAWDRPGLWFLLLLLLSVEWILRRKRGLA
jgi:uncharacterized membrane protein